MLASSLRRTCFGSLMRDSPAAFKGRGQMVGGGLGEAGWRLVNSKS